MNKLLLIPLLALTVSLGHAAIITGNAIALHGAPALPAGFKSFAYARADAPKGGELRLRALGTFDSTNPFINKGNPVEGTDYLYDSLTVQALDEPFTRYGLLAEKSSVIRKTPVGSPFISIRPPVSVMARQSRQKMWSLPLT